MKRQIRGELAWQRLQRRQIEPFVNVGDDEVQAVIDAAQRRRAARPNIESPRSSSRATPETAAEVRGQCRADRPADPRRRLLPGLCAPIFRSLDRGARRRSRLGPRRAAARRSWPPLVREMPVGAVSDPIPVPGGFSIVALADTRQILVADPRDARAQPDADVDRAAGRARPRRRPRRGPASSAQATQAMGGCGRAAEAAQRDRRRARLERPGPGPRAAAAAAADAAQPQRRPGDAAVRLGRADQRPRPVRPRRSRGGDRPELRRRSTTQLNEERVNRRAQRYLRDLRRDAVVDYR